MEQTDPRERYDDLHVVRREHEVERERFEELAELESFRSGWVTVAVTLDADDRVLLAHDEDDDLWVLPGGTVKRDESLDDALVRELDEETGVTVRPERPHGLKEQVVVCEGETVSFCVVMYDARPEGTAVGSDLGVADESISEARWFADLPTDTFDREYAAQVLQRVRSR